MIDAQRMAVLVNQKLCHDFAEPLNALMTGLDLLKDSPLAAKNADAMSLIEQGVEKAKAKLLFFRFALEGSGAGEEAALEDVREMATDLYRQLRPELNWNTPAVALPKPSLRVILGLLFLAADAAPRGAVEITAANGEIKIVSSGPRSKMKPSTAAALRGEPEEGEYDSRSILPGLIGMFARQESIDLVLRETADRVEIIARSPQFRAISAAA